MFAVLKKDIILRPMKKTIIQHNNQGVSSLVLTDTVFSFTPPIAQFVVNQQSTVYSEMSPLTASQGLLRFQGFQGIVFRDINDIN